MAMFGSSHKETPKNQDIDKISNASTNIGKGATLQGNIDTFGNVRVDGKLIGDIRSKSKVATGNASLVEGSITAQNAEIEGEVKGSLEIAELLVLKSTAVVNGDIITAKMVVEAGAIFNGRCQMGDINQIKKMMNELKENKTENNSPTPKTENIKEETTPTNSVFSDLKI
ncbi:MAG: polymer-forming cytoskeletal protein [Raineya sp.]|nr:polymer-forming cytoskeletal protein [Raineya sp.]MDW8295493.1 polymer-forming cytoskeletal protein [Raineya sp.]